MPIYPAFAVSCEGRFLFNRKVILLNKKRSAEDRNSKEGLFTTTAYYYYIKHGIGSFHRPLNFFGNLLYTLSLKNTIIPPAFIKHLYKNKRYQFYLSYIHPGLIRSEH